MKAYKILVSPLR